MSRLVILLVALFALGGCSQTTNSIAAGSKMTTKGYAFAPPAFRPFCAKQPRLCSTVGQAKPVELTPARQAQLAEVNSSVNHRIRERSDVAATGMADDWELPTKVGDCEDFAILKKSELLKRGWPASALLLTVVTLGGAGHTVLTVRTDKGDLILDNRTSSIKNWTQTSYRFFARQSQAGLGKWDRIGS